MARHSAQIYPKKMGKHEAGFFESGAKEDPHYIYKSKIIDGDVVYVTTPDFATFLERFSKLPKDVKIVLVTGGEDIGTPYELFHPQREYRSYNMDHLWPRGQTMDMETFILDPRLHKWFVQNYDLVGCNHFTCSTVTQEGSKRDPKMQKMIEKVIPIPIGLDLHTLSEKSKKKNRKRGSTIDGLVCDQLRELYSVSHSRSVLPFMQRELKVNAEFACDFGTGAGLKFRQLTRGKLCGLIDKADPLIYKRKVDEGTDQSLKDQKTRFWTRLTKVAFSFAPPGYGMDTHRAWEILAMRTVPIVISSPLDPLHKQFPIVIVRSWEEAFTEGALTKFREEIKQKWGEEPFSSDVMNRLSLVHWIDLVNNATSAFTA